MAFKLGSLPYLETSEARYAEISREMLESGDWITPKLIYIKHFHKPPLTYWITAASYKVLGVNNLSGRIPLYLAALGILLFTGLCARLLFRDKNDTPVWSVLILLSSPLFLIQTRILTADTYLTLFTLMSIYWHWIWLFKDRKTRYIILSAVSMGLAVLTKGHIPIMLSGLPWLVYYLVKRKWTPGWWRPLLLYITIVLILSLPWFIAVIQQNPSLLEYLVSFHIVQRAASDVHQRGGSPIYFIAVLLIGMGLWFNHAFSGFYHLVKDKVKKQGEWQELLLGIYIFLPLIIFSLAGSKLPPYVLPLTPLLAIWIAYRLFVRDGDKNKSELILQRIGLTISSVLFGALAVAPIPHVPAMIDQQRFWFWWPLVLSTTLLTLTFLRFFRRRDLIYAGYALINILVFLILAAIAPSATPELNGYQGIAEVINQHKQSESRIIAYRDRLPSLTFYTGIRVIQVEHDRETQFENPEAQSELERYLFADRADLQPLLDEDLPSFLVIKKKQWQKILKQNPELSSKMDTLQQTSKVLLLSTDSAP